MKNSRLVIGGATVATVHHREVLNPSTGDVIGFMPVATVVDLDAAVGAASTAFDTWKNVTETERVAACRRIADIIDSNSEELARLLTLEQGKPLGGFGSRFEIGGAIAWTRHTADIALPVEVLQDGPEGRVEMHQTHRRGRLDHPLELAYHDRLLAHHSGSADWQHRGHQAFA
jgi:acyl-CoA reductase-like NAD-dependent aldehyde dehydrogenase